MFKLKDDIILCVILINMQNVLLDLFLLTSIALTRVFDYHPTLKMKNINKKGIRTSLKKAHNFYRKSIS